MKKEYRTIFNEIETSKEEMIVLEGMVLVDASEKKHKVFKRNKTFNNLICKN